MRLNFLVIMYKFTIGLVMLNVGKLSNNCILNTHYLLLHLARVLYVSNKTPTGKKTKLHRRIVMFLLVSN